MNNFHITAADTIMTGFPEKESIMHSDVIGRIAKLLELEAPDLKKLWRELYGKEPPPFNQTYFVRRLAYRLQELAYSVDSSALNCRLEMHAKQHMDLQGKIIRKTAGADHPAAGTRLMREYQGEEHHVTVLHGGFEYRGKRYKSLSGIARAITGTQWSGPLFFGLKRKGGLA